jgi:hypothetical protein
MSFTMRHAAAALRSAVFLALAASAWCGTRPGAIVTVGLRYDDCAASSPESLETHVLAACARTGVPITFGVVPRIGAGDNHDPAPAGNLPLPQSRKEMLAAAQKRGILEIALHGYAHRAARAGMRSEFGGVPAAEQREILSRGKAELEAFAGPVVRTFIPPWNAYDRATLAGLAAAGFTALSADPLGPVDPGTGIRHVPATCLVPELRRAVAAARAAGGGIVIPYFHPYELKEINPRRGFFTLAELDSALEWLAAQPDVQTLTLGEIAALRQAQPEAYAGYSRWARLAPPFLERTLRPAFRVYPHPAFPVALGGPWLRLLVVAWYLLIAAAGFVAQISLNSLIFRKKQPAAPVTRGLALTLAGAALVLSGALSASFPLATGGSALLGVGIGLRRTGRGRKYPM